MISIKTKIHDMFHKISAETPLRKRWVKLLVCVLLAAAAISVLVFSQKKDPLPRPEFPLSEAALTAALEETGLAWSIEQADTFTSAADISISYSLNRPESGKDYNTFFVNSFDSEEYGRRLQIFFVEPQNRLWTYETVNDARWEDWRDTLVLVARLYGGFEDAEEIYRTCSAVELPKDNQILWQGALTGGYFRMTTKSPMKPDRFSLGNTVSFNVYESEAYYLKFAEKAEEAQKAREERKKEWEKKKTTSECKN